MQKKPYRESIIDTTVKNVKALATEVNLDDVEAVKHVLPKKCL
jgi:hypothetical protein